MIFKARNFLIAVGLSALVILLLLTFSSDNPMHPAIPLAPQRVRQWHANFFNVSESPKWRKETHGTSEPRPNEGGFSSTEDEDQDGEAQELWDASNGTRQMRLMEKYREEAKRRKDGKYLIYLCDDDVRCSGFADRQRAVVGLYLLSIATNRTFGIIMTNPFAITDFYVPTKDVKWDIKAADLAGKSSVVLPCIQTFTNCSFNNFNSQYPQDVVYIRSKGDFLQILGTNEKYRNLLPEWAKGTRTIFFGQAWISLMMPSKMLRQEINNLLYDIAKGMQADVRIIPKVQQTGDCQIACKAITQKGKSDNDSVEMCLEKLRINEGLAKEYHARFLRTICPVKTFIRSPSLQEITDATGYDYVDLNLVCVQIRLGRSSTIANEPVINDIKDVKNIWKIVHPYINRGHHMFLASDSQEVRDQATELFGSRVHVNREPIVHINKVRAKQDGWLGMKTALEEQLLLSTSCKVLVFTASGFGRRSAMVRHVLTKGLKGFETFEFSDGKVRRKDFNHKSDRVPSPAL